MTKLKITITIIYFNKAMEPFFWKESYNTGIKQIDIDHQCIVAMTNDLYNIVRNNEGRSAVIKQCRIIVHFTEAHFSREEIFMDTVNFQGAEEHKIEHSRLKEEARKLLLRLELGAPGSDMGLYHVLQQIFIEHIPEFDKKFSEHYILSQESL